MAKRSCRPPEAIGLPSHIKDIYSVSNCVNDNFEEGFVAANESYVDFWKHNDYWFYDSPGIIRDLSKEHSIDLAGTLLFYYELFEEEFVHGEGWRPLTPNKFILGANVVIPAHGRLEGYDVTSTWVENSPDPEHSPLSCNGLAREIETNMHCLFGSIDQAKSSIDRGEFEGGEPGTLRLIAVYSVEWPVN